MKAKNVALEKMRPTQMKRAKVKIRLLVCNGIVLRRVNYNPGKTKLPTSLRMTQLVAGRWVFVEIEKRRRFFFTRTWVQVAPRESISQTKRNKALHCTHCSTTVPNSYLFYLCTMSGFKPVLKSAERVWNHQLLISCCQLANKSVILLGVLPHSEFFNFFIKLLAN